MRVRNGLTLVLLACLLASLPGYRPAVAQATSQPDFGELERVVLAELKETNTPGAAVAVISGDKVVFAKGFGVSNTETGSAVTPDMLFRLGSTTKMFTAAALVTLAEQGRVKLDAPIGDYVKGLNPKIGAVTAHQLLSHTAGIIDEAPMYGRHDDSALGEEIRGWKEDKLFTEPGVIISYSNPGYWLAGLVIQEVAGKPYADQMSEGLFEPLGMKRTTLRPTLAMTFPLSQGHNPTRSGIPTVIHPMADNSASWPAGSIFSSVEELARFVIAFLNDGKIDGKRVLSPDVISKMATGHASIPGNPNRKYGYGLMIGDNRGVLMFEHGGSRSGYGSTISMAPRQRFGVIVLTNRSGASLNKTVTKAMELMLPLKPIEATAKRDLPMTTAEMSSYGGTYVQGATRLEIFLRDGRLMGRQGTAEGEITKTGDQTFSIAMPNGASTFALVPGAGGKPEYLHSGLRSLKRAQQ